MNTIQQNKTNKVLNELFNDSKFDRLKMIKSMSKRIVRPIGPSDFKDVYLSISREQGEDLVKLIRENNSKHIIEFGTSFGISTLFLAQGALFTQGNIITTELIKSKAEQAKQNFEKAGVADMIEVRVGDAMETLRDHTKTIDLLLLDGWKDLYLPLFKMLAPNFHSKTIIYVDNADMSETRDFLAEIAKDDTYALQSQHHDKVVIITIN